MGFLGEAGVTALWNKVRANFGRSISVSGTTITLKNGADTPTNLSQVTIPDATTSTAGAMSAADKTKLEGVEERATRVIVDSALSDSSTNAVQNKVVQAAIASVSSTASAAQSTANSAAEQADKAFDAAAGTQGTIMTSINPRLNGLDDAVEAAQNTANEAKALAESGSDDKTWNGLPLTRETDTEENRVNFLVTGLRDTNASTAKFYPAAYLATNNTIAIRSMGGYLRSTTPNTTSDTDVCATTKWVNDAIANAQVGAAMYKGAVSSNDTISGSDYKAGWYWVVATAGTYVGESCEAGDMIFARTNKSGTYSADHFDVVQNNIVELSAQDVEAICVV